MVRKYEDQLIALLPETHGLLCMANFIVHPSVSMITLHGTRGLARGYRPDSDIDLSLIVDVNELATDLELGVLLRDVLDTTLSFWRSPVEADLAAVYDTQGCGLACFGRTSLEECACSPAGVDCFGVYKIQKGYDGFVVDAGLDVRRMYPCLTIWRKTGREPFRCVE